MEKSMLSSNILSSKSSSSESLMQSKEDSTVSAEITHQELVVMTSTTVYSESIIVEHKVVDSKPPGHRLRAGGSGAIHKNPTSTPLDHDDHGDDDHQQQDDDGTTKRALEYIEEVTKNAGEVQRRVLSEILTRNADAEYLKAHGLSLGEANNVDELEVMFKKKIPVVTYEDIAPYIKKIANDGDTSPLLCSLPISELLASSGTSGGESKLLPVTEEEKERRSIFGSLAGPVLGQFIPGIDKKKGLAFLLIKPEAKTPGGLTARAAMTSMYKSKRFLDRPFDPYTSPNEAILCPDPFQSMYSQMLCGLCLREEVFWVGGTFAYGLIHAIKFLEKNWEPLCNDIRSGSLDPRVADPGVRGAVSRILRPDPTLADLVESEFSKGGSPRGGIITRLWPNAKCLVCVATGTMSQYVPTLDFLSDGLPIVSTLYASSEGFFGLNLDPLRRPSDVAYTIIPTMAYFEFLPVDWINDNGGMNVEEELVDLVDVKLGQEYEIIVTNYCGLYRFRVGDVLRVAGFKNKSPQFSFVRRANVVLSIAVDKTDEVELQDAVNSAASRLAPLGVSLLDYTSHSDTSTVPGHYVLFWELTHNTNVADDDGVIPTSVLEDCCLAIEESLSSIYREGRASDKSIGPLEIRVVENGTFDKLMEYATTKGGASLNQYKTPRSVKSGPMIELLNSRVISKSFSPKCPTWAPGHKDWSSKEE